MKTNVAFALIQAQTKCLAVLGYLIDDVWKKLFKAYWPRIEKIIDSILREKDHVLFVVEFLLLIARDISLPPKDTLTANY